MEKFNGRPVGLIQYFQYKTKIFLAKRNGRCPITFKVILAVLFTFSLLERFKNKFKVLIQPYQRKVKIFLAKCNNRHPVIFRITLAVLSAVSFAVLFKFVLGFDLIISCKFAALFIPLIYVHELGHAWAMKKCGIVVQGIFFIPFLGAATISKDDTDHSQTLSRAGEAFIYLMGPVWGLVLGVIATGAYFLTDIQLFADIAIWSVILNLFNLVPLMPLDGGGVAKAISFSVKRWFGFGLMAIVIIVAFILSYLYIQGLFGLLIVCFILIMAIGDFLMMAIGDFRRKYVLRKKIDYCRPMSWKMIVVLTLAYLASIAVLCGIIYLIVFF